MKCRNQCGITGIRKNIMCELCGISKCLGGVILSALAGVAVLIIGYILFGGPCRIAMFFRVPGGGFTVVMHYVLWILMFAAAGVELFILRCFSGRRSGETVLHHIAAHLCLFLWYPLFFTTMAQLLALIVLAAALVLLILTAKSAVAVTSVVFVSSAIKVAVCAVYLYVNLAFIIIN